MTTATTTLATFLLERIAEDEADARNWAALGGAGEVESLEQRVLAECAAKRAIVAGWHHFGDDEYADGMEEALRQTLCHLAAVYADHPDYRDEWRP